MNRDRQAPKRRLSDDNATTVAEQRQNSPQWREEATCLCRRYLPAMRHQSPPVTEATNSRPSTLSGNEEAPAMACRRPNVTQWRQGATSNLGVLASICDLFLPAGASEDTPQQQNASACDVHNANAIAGCCHELGSLFGFNWEGSADVIHGSMDTSEVKASADASSPGVEATLSVSAFEEDESRQPPMTEPRASHPSASSQDDLQVRDSVTTRHDAIVAVSAVRQGVTSNTECTLVWKCDIEDDDILFESKASGASHPGTKRFGNLVMKHRRTFKSSNVRKRTKLIAAIVRQLTSRGRFIRKIGNGPYYIMPEDERKEVVREALCTSNGPPPSSSSELPVSRAYRKSSTKTLEIGN